MHTIRTCAPSYFTGRTDDGEQLLLGWHSDFIAVLLFDKMGDLLETKEYPLGIDLNNGLGPVVEAKVSKKVRTVKRQLGFHKGPILVKPFYVERWQIGLKRFPEHLEEFLTYPSRFPEGEAAFYRRDIKRWIADRNCVLKWDDDYYLNKDGNTI